MSYEEGCSASSGYEMGSSGCDASDGYYNPPSSPAVCSSSGGYYNPSSGASVWTTSSSRNYNSGYRGTMYSSSGFGQTCNIIIIVVVIIVFIIAVIILLPSLR